MADEDVVIRVRSDTGQGAQGLEEIKQKVQGMKAPVGQLSQGFGQLVDTIGRSAIAALGFGVSFRQLIVQTQESNRSMEFTSLVVGALGRQFQERFREIEPQMRGIAQDFGFIETEAERAFAVIARESRNASIGIKEVQFAMGLARVANISLEQAAGIVGRALLGDVEGLRAIVGEVTSIEDIMERVIEAGRGATGPIDVFTGSIRQGMEDFFSKDFIEIFKTAWEILGRELNLNTWIERFKSALGAVFGEGFPLSVLPTISLPSLSDFWRIVKNFFAIQPPIIIANLGIKLITLSGLWDLIKKWFLKQDFLPLPGITITGQDLLDFWKRIKDWVKRQSILDILSVAFLGVDIEGLRRFWENIKGWISGREPLVIPFLDVEIPTLQSLWDKIKQWFEDHPIPLPFLGGSIFPGGGDGGRQHPGVGFPPLEPAPSPSPAPAPSPSPAPAPGDDRGARFQACLQGNIGKGFSPDTAFAMCEHILSGPASLRHGGIVRRPTLAMVGEAGPEAVVPLSGLGGLGNITINVYGNIDSEIRARDFAREVKRLLQEDIRRGIGF